MIAPLRPIDDDGEDRGIRCPRCHCPHVPYEPHQVDRTITLGRNRSIHRKRVCRHCGHRFGTYERVAGYEPPTEDTHAPAEHD